jgi:hypothetical protein
MHVAPTSHHRLAGKEPEWFLKIESGGIITRVDSTLECVADLGQLRVTFVVAGGRWELRFPSADIYRAFMTELKVRGVDGGWAVRLHWEPCKWGRADRQVVPVRGRIQAQLRAPMIDSFTQGIMRCRNTLSCHTG